MALISAPCIGNKKDLLSQASLERRVFFIPGLAYASHDFFDENNHADLRQTTFGRTLKICLRPPENGHSSLSSPAGNNLGCDLL